MPRARTSQAEKRIALDEAATKTTAIPSFEELAVILGPYVAGSLETLGKEAAAGNVNAAKAVLDFLAATAKSERSNEEGLDTLKEIARIRAARPA